MFAQTRNEVRSHFILVWQKMVSNSPLEPLEQLLASVIERHPEYHIVLNEPDRALETEYDPASPGANPFLHMSLHVAIAEQLQTDRPPGVVVAYTNILEKRGGDLHATEHKMMECLSASLWQAQTDSTPPDEVEYLASLRRLA